MIVPDGILSQGCTLFGLDPSKAVTIGGNNGAVYSVPADDGEYIIKFVYVNEPDIPVALDMVKFINYLDNNGVGIASYQPSVSGNNMERLRTDAAGTGNGSGASTILVSKHRKALGRHIDPRNPEDWTEKNFKAWGAAMGRMHALTKNFSGAPLIKQWNDEVAYMISACKDEEVKAKWQSLRETLSRLPKGPDDYGLIHNDLHPRNFFVYDGRLTIIDFDVCVHHWFMIDIGIALFSVIQRGPREPKARKINARSFLDAFLEGYSDENTISREWLAKMHMFLRYRQMLLYSVRCADSYTLYNWRQSIVNDIPII